MKKVLSLLIVMVCTCLQMSAQFVEGKQYLIKQDNCGLYVALGTGNDSAGGASNTTQACLAAEGTAFYVTEDGDGFVFSTEDDKYLSNTHSWNITTSDASVWYLTDNGDGTYGIWKNTDYTKGLGCDNYKAGAGLYNDKGVSAGNCWSFEEYVAPEVTHAVYAEVDGEQSKMLSDGEGGYEVTVVCSTGEHTLVINYDGKDVYNSTFTTTDFEVNGSTYTEGKVSIAYNPEANEVSVTGDGIAAGEEPAGWDGTWTFDPEDGATLPNEEAMKTVKVTFNGAKEVSCTSVACMVTSAASNHMYYVCYPTYAAYFPNDDLGNVEVVGNMVIFTFGYAPSMGCSVYEEGDLLTSLSGIFTVDGEEVKWASTTDNIQYLNYSVAGAPEKGVYIIGIDDNWDPSTPSLTVEPTELGEYIFNYTTTKDTWFAIGTVLGADVNDWDTFNANKLGAPEPDYALHQGDVVDLTLGLNNSFFIPAGEWQIEIDPVNMKLYVYKGAEDKPWEPASIEVVGTFNNWGEDVQEEHKLVWDEMWSSWMGYFDLPAGTHKFKFRADGSCAHNWGGELIDGWYTELVKDGANIVIELAKPATVNFQVWGVTEEEAYCYYYSEPIILPFSPDEGQVYNIMYTETEGIDCENVAKGSDGCTTLVTSSATPSKVTFAQSGEGWTIKSGDKYIAAFRKSNGSLGWSTELSDEPYVWTIDGTNDEFRLIREDGKNVKVEYSSSNGNNAYCLYCDNTDDSKTAFFHLQEVVTTWNGEVGVSMKDALTCEVVFEEAHKVDVTNYGVLGGIYDEGGDIVALAVANADDAVAGGVEIAGRKATVHFETIEALMNKGVDAKALAKKIGGFTNNGEATVYICGKSFKADGEMLEDAIILDYNYATGNTTGIETVESVAAVKIFDLQGRRIVAPANGVFIQNSQKIVK